MRRAHPETENQAIEGHPLNQEDCCLAIQRWQVQRDDAELLAGSTENSVRRRQRQRRRLQPPLWLLQEKSAKNETGYDRPGSRSGMKGMDEVVSYCHCCPEKCLHCMPSPFWGLNCFRHCYSRNPVESLQQVSNPKIRRASQRILGDEKGLFSKQLLVCSYLNWPWLVMNCAKVAFT